MSERTKIIGLWLTLALLLALLLLQFFGYIQPVEVEQWDIVATILWSVLPGFICLVLFYVARLLKVKAEYTEAQTWELRDSSKRARDYHREWLFTRK